jgi:hypothetical protein
MRYTPSFSSIATALCVASVFSSVAEADLDSFYGKVPVKINPVTKGLKEATSDTFGSELTIDGRTDIPLDPKSRLAQNLLQDEQRQISRAQTNKTIRADIASGQPVKIFIAPEHFVQISFMKENEIVFPKRAFTGQPDLLVIDKRDGSPNIYVAASVPIQGQTTNLFVETEEEGRIQTYVLDLVVARPENIRPQVQVNLVQDQTPPLRGREGSEVDPNKTLIDPTNLTGIPQSAKAAPTRNGDIPPFTEKEIKKYLSTMIKMADQYPDAKNIEEKTGKIIYRDSDIQMFPGGSLPWEDPIERTHWKVHQVWYFQKYDAILLDVRIKNDTDTTSNWDYSQVHWMINRSQQHYATTSASPYRMQTLPHNTNQVWYLLQGNHLDPNSDFGPVFPRAEKRGSRDPLPVNLPASKPPKSNPTNYQSTNDGKGVIPIQK